MSSDHDAVCHLSHADQAVSLAHLSDPHLPPPSLSWSSFFLNKRLLSLILWRLQRRHVHLPSINDDLLKTIHAHAPFSATLVSGDITNFGTEEEYRASRQWLKRLPPPTLVVPGNHDMMVSSPPEKSLHLWKEWEGHHFPYVRFIGRVAIIGLNSGIPTPPFTAYGRLGAVQLAKLDSLLRRLGKEGYCRVIMIHHPPKEGLLPRRKSLLETRAFAAILRDRGAELVLHGHSHHATCTTIDHTAIPVIGVGAASLKSQNPQKEASWNHFTIAPQEKNWHIRLSRYHYQGRMIHSQEWVSPIGDPS